MRVILASQSEGRKKLLDTLHIPYEIVPSNIDEKEIHHHDPLVRVARIAEAKARAIAPSCPNALIITGDTLVAIGDDILEKPATAAEAKQMLKRLSGKTCAVITGLAVFNTKTNERWIDADSSTITFRSPSEEEISDYITHCPVTRYAGAFEECGVQRFAERVEGSPSTITGLPMHKLIPVLRKNGITI